MNWLPYFWTASALAGLYFSGRNVRLAYLRWRILQARGVREALLITAFTSVRTHSIMIYVHLTFLLLGVRAVFPTIFDTLLVNVILDAFILVPILLIIASVTIHDDGARALALEKNE